MFGYCAKWLCQVVSFMFLVPYIINCGICFKIEESQISNWADTFKHTLDTHVENILGYNQIQDMLRQHEKDLVFGPINGKDVFTKIHESISIKHSDLLYAVKNIKAAVESRRVKRDLHANSPLQPSPLLPQGQGSSTGGSPPALGIPVAPGKHTGIPPPLSNPGVSMPPPLSPPGVVPDIDLQQCCVALGQGVYSGRFRDDVLPNECFGHIDDTLRQLAKTNLTDTFKSNLDKRPSITWQYFADTDGRYVQYPANDRACDETSPNIASPLVQDWFVEKLHMERKNLILVLDNSDSTGQSWQGPVTRGHQLIEAVHMVLGTLTPQDKVNVVILPSGNNAALVPDSCQGELFVATQSNLDLIVTFTQQLPPPTGSPNLLEGLQKAYQLFEDDQRKNQVTFQKRSNIILLLVDGTSTPVSIANTALLSMMARQQDKLNHSIQHFVYSLGHPDTGYMDTLALVADQNNLKLNTSSGIIAKPWTPIAGLVTDGVPVGKEGVLEIIDELSTYPDTVAMYFQHLPPQIDTEATTLAPQLDSKSGLYITVATPVYHHDNVTVGVAAVDATMATVFSDIVNFHVGEDSYAYLVDVTHGDVLLHPKLRNPSDTRYEDTVYPRLQKLEPELSTDELQSILASTVTLSQFITTLTVVRPFLTGELVTPAGNQSTTATVYHQLLGGTSLSIVMVHFLSDTEEIQMQRNQIKSPLHAPYHRIDKLVPAPVQGNKPNTDDVCYLDGRHFVSFKESVIKLSPWVFSDPETYKYTAESQEAIEEINKFLVADKDTNRINQDLKDVIQQTIRATDKLDLVWTSTAKHVIERFYGSVSGVFRVYPGIPMQNGFDHIQTKWYKRSIAYPSTTMYHYGRLSVLNRQNVILVSRALVEKGRLQGVVGMTVTPRFLVSQLISQSTECSRDTECHIVDRSGNMLDILDATTDRHISSRFPWLTTKLANEGILKMEWCTAFSDGYHKMTFTLTQVVTSDLDNADPCLQYSLHDIANTNLHILVMGNRHKLKCDDTKYKVCTSCQHVMSTPMYHLSIPKCQYCLSDVKSQCQCQCYCDTDFDKCRDTYTANQTNFPLDACFYPPVEDSHLELQPESPGPGDPKLDRCPIPCVAIEDLDICAGLTHCKLSTGVYPTCIWMDDQELINVNVSRFFPTSTPPHPPTPPQFTNKHTDQPLSTASTITGQPTPGITTRQANPSTHKSSSPVQTPPSLISTTDSSHIYNIVSTASLPVTSHPVAMTSHPAAMTSHPAAMTSHPVAMTSHPEAMTSPPVFVTSSSGSSTLVSGVSTAAYIHPISGSSVPSTTQAHVELDHSSDKQRGGISGGGIAGIVISVLVLMIIGAFIVVKVYGKKFRRPGADDSYKYRARSGMFDSTLFNRSLDQVSIGTAPTSTVPYQDMDQ